MNKVLTAALMGLSAMALVGCSQDETSSLKGSKYKGMVESGIDSRSYNTNKGETGIGEFKWSEGDDISVWTKRHNFQTMKQQSTDGDIAYYEDNPNITPLDVAVFPVSAAKSYDTESKATTVNYPVAYDYTQRDATDDNQIADDPMVAYYGKGATTFVFHHTGAVIEWDVRVPAQANKFVVTMSKDVTGDFSVTEDSPAAVTTDSTTNNVVTFTFTPANDTQDLHLYMPVPTGEYHISRVAVMKDNSEIKGYDNPKGANERTIKRCKWITVELNMASYIGIIEDASTASKLRQLAKLGGIATISANIDVDSTIVVESGKTLKVNLNDLAVSNSSDLWDQTPSSWSLFSAQGGTLEFNGEGTVKAKKDDCYAVDVQDGGKVVINGGHFVGNIHAVYVEKGTAEINGGVFEIQQTFPDAGKEYEFVLNCYDSSYKAGTASIVVKGGTFVGFNPANCKAEGANTNFVAEGYTSVETTYNGKQAWTVVKNVEVSTAAELKQAAATGAYATLNADVDLDETVFVKSGKVFAINLNGKTINNSIDLWDQTPSSWSLFSAQGGTLIIEGEGTVKAKENDCYAVDVQDSGKVVVNGGHIVGNIHAVYVHTGTAEINGGVFEIQQTYPDASKAYEFVLNCYDANREAGIASIVVKGGTFVKFNPANCKAEGDNTNFVADGYASTETTYEGQTAWKVAK